MFDQLTEQLAWHRVKVFHRKVQLNSNFSACFCIFIGKTREFIFKILLNAQKTIQKNLCGALAGGGWWSGISKARDDSASDGDDNNEDDDYEIHL